jgi:hypothetical protein
MSSLTELLAEVVVPLEEAEERRAVEAALTHLELRRPLVYGAELRIEKRRGSVPDRQVAVLLADLDGFSVYEVVIAEDGTVVEAVKQPQLVPPFSAEEIAEATVLARGHPEVAEAARRWGVRPAVFYPSSHNHSEKAGEERHRPRRWVGSTSWTSATPPLSCQSCPPWSTLPVASWSPSKTTRPSPESLPRKEATWLCSATITWQPAPTGRCTGALAS